MVSHYGIVMVGAAVNRLSSMLTAKEVLHAMPDAGALTVLASSDQGWHADGADRGGQPPRTSCSGPRADRGGGDSGNWLPLGDELRSRFARATAEVLAAATTRRPRARPCSGARSTCEPYVDPINLVEIELLARLRQPDAERELMRAFAITGNGIAAGMRNTG